MRRPQPARIQKKRSRRTSGVTATAMMTRSNFAMAVMSVAWVRRFKGSMDMPRTTRYQWPRSMARLTLPSKATEARAPAMLQATFGGWMVAWYESTEVTRYARPRSVAEALKTRRLG